MVLTKEELVASLQKEVRIFVHLVGKIDKSKLDYRPTPKQRSTLELLQYMAIMGPTQIGVLKAGVFTKPAMMEAWSSAEAASKTMSFEQAMAAIEKQAAEFDRMFSEWTEADFREELDMLGIKKTRGFLLVNIVLSGFAAYRMQLFCYLKSCGREELNTLNLWMGADGSMAAS
jgi:hypothetical protein